MRRFLTVVTASGMVITAPAPALALASTHALTASRALTTSHALTATPAVHHGRGPLPAYSVRATPSSARMSVGHRATMNVTVKNKTRHSQPGRLTIRWRARGSTARLAVTAARHCAYDRKAATSACSFSVGPGATTRISFAVRGTAPGVANAIVTATPDRAAGARRSGRAHAAARTAPARTSATLKIVRRSRATQHASGMLVRLAGPSHATHGMSVRYTATVANHGRQAARGVQLKIGFPAGMTHLALTPKTAACKIAGHLVKCTFRRIQAAGTASVTVRTAVTAPVWRQVAVATRKAHHRAQTARAQTSALSAAQLRTHHGQRQDVTYTVRRRLTVTARITHVMCPCLCNPAGPAGTAGPAGPAGPNYVPGSQATITTVMQPNTPVAPMAVPGRTLSPAKLPTTGVPVLPVTAAGAALLSLGALGLIAACKRRRASR